MLLGFSISLVRSIARSFVLVGQQQGTLLSAHRRKVATDATELLGQMFYHTTHGVTGSDSHAARQGTENKHPMRSSSFHHRQHIHLPSPAAPTV